MAPNIPWKPHSSLTVAPTNLKEAIDWVLRVTGRDGKPLSGDECICGLAAAVTDLLQSVELEYHGYQGDKVEENEKKRVEGQLHNLFSLVQGLGGTAVVRTYIDQLAQVLSALVGWSRIETCGGDKCKGTGGNGHRGNKCCCSTGGAEKHTGSPGCCKGKSGTVNCKNNKECSHHHDGCKVICANGCCSHGGKGCKNLNPVMPNDPCDKCECKIVAGKGNRLGRGCKKCSDSSKTDCECNSRSGMCTSADTCKCAKEGKCCKCYCKEKCSSGCAGEKAKCICVEEEQSYKSAYPKTTRGWSDGGFTLTWVQLVDTWMEKKSDNKGASQRRHQCAQILLGSVCLIWSGLTYMYWTGKYEKTSPRWNNHILDGSGLDDGTLSQWLQALGFPKEMLNDSGPKNRLDQVITDELKEKLFIGFIPPKGIGMYVSDRDGNTAREPRGFNYAGFVHAINRDSFNEQARVFGSDENGALYKLYILSCAYFTGLQNDSPPKTDNNAPKTIREILYWLSALPYSPAYQKILEHSKGKLQTAISDYEENKDEKNKLDFTYKPGERPFTVRKVDLYAHFQAVTQYCPLVLIGIQGGIHSANNTTPAIHALYANTECGFTYPTVSIQAYNQVVHYIRGLFYQLYFLRKQCAVKVTQGGKWRECRYGSGVLGKDVVSWMCLGCDPMEHDRKWRVEKVKGELGKVVPQGTSEELVKTLKEVLEAIGQVVVQLGNAQEALEGKKADEINKVKEELRKAKEELEKVKNGVLNGEQKLKEAKDALEALTTKNGGSGILDKLIGGEGLEKAEKDGKEVDPGKNKISEAIKGVREALEALKKVVEGLKKEKLERKKSVERVFALEVLFDEENALDDAIEQLLSICNSPKCPPCHEHAKKCGKTPKPTICRTCLQPTTTGVPSPLQAFLEDRLPGFSCEVVRGTEDTEYPSAASHLHHTSSPGQCCPVPMGFRNSFYKGSSSDSTGARLYGILYFFSNRNLMQSCIYRLVRVTAALSATTPQVLGDVFGFFRGGVGEKENGMTKKGQSTCDHQKDPKDSKHSNDYFCGWCASGLRDVVKQIGWIPKKDDDGGKYRGSVGKALIDIKGEKDASTAPQPAPQSTTSNLSTLTDSNHYVSPLTGELYTAVSATFGNVYLSWVLYLSDALHWGLESLASEFRNIECRGCRGCDPNKCKMGEHGQKSAGGCGCSSIVSCTGVLPVLYRHGFSYGNPFNLEGYQQRDGKTDGQYDITKDDKSIKHCHEFFESLKKVLDLTDRKEQHPLHALTSAVGQLQYDIRLPWIFVLALAWLVAVLYLAFGAIWPLDWTHMRSHWLRGGEHQWQCMWYKVMTGRKGVDLMEYFGKT